MWTVCTAAFQYTHECGFAVAARLDCVSCPIQVWPRGYFLSLCPLWCGICFQYKLWDKAVLLGAQDPGRPGAISRIWLFTVAIYIFQLFSYFFLPRIIYPCKGGQIRTLSRIRGRSTRYPPIWSRDSLSRQRFSHPCLLFLVDWAHFPLIKWSTYRQSFFPGGCPYKEGYFGWYRIAPETNLVAGSLPTGRKNGLRSLASQIQRRQSSTAAGLGYVSKRAKNVESASVLPAVLSNGMGALALSFNSSSCAVSQASREGMLNYGVGQQQKVGLLWRNKGR